MSAAWPDSGAVPLPGSYRYQRHRPENTLLRKGVRYRLEFQAFSI